MSHKHHSWHIGVDPPTIRPHSQAKHRLIRAYLERYVSVLTADPRQDKFRITLVDGFAGGGLYRDTRAETTVSGSPLIMLEAMEQAHAAAQLKRSKPFHLDAQYIFIEKSKRAAEYLANVLGTSRFASLIGDRIVVLRGRFEEHATAIAESIRHRGGRSIFVLDQFGYTDVPLQIIRDILATLPNAEIILTFATDSLIDYLALDEDTQLRLQKAGITLPSDTIASAKRDQDWRRIIQFALHREIPQKTGAAYYTPFFIRSSDAHRDFWLIHLSGHYRARDVMVGLHWQESTTFAHYGRSGLRMLGYDQERDDSWFGQKMLPGFYFDETARAASQAELLDQLPDQIYGFEQGVAFNDLFASITNDCPVTAEIMREVCSELLKEGIILARSKTGVSRRHRITHQSDILIPNPQKRLFLRGSE